MSRAFQGCGLLAACVGVALIAACGGAAEDPESGPDVSEIPLRESGEPARGEVVATQAGGEFRFVRLLGDSTSFGRITAIHPLEGFLLVSDQLAAYPVVAVDLESGTVASRVGQRGQGPNEFTAPMSFSPSEDPRAAWLHDFSNRRITEVRVDEEGVSTLVDELPLQLNATLENPVWLGDTIAASAVVPDATIVFLDRSGVALSRVLFPRPFPSEEVGHTTGDRFLNRTSLTGRPSGDRLALGYYSANRIDIVSRSGELLRSVEGPRPVDARYHVAEGRFFWDDGNELGYTRLAASEDFIFALFCGCRLEVEGSPVSPMTVHVFDWEGAFQGEFDLGHEVFTATVSQDGRALYGSVETPYPMIGEWSIPEAFWPTD